MTASASPGREPQCASAVLMVRPSHFGYNPETAASNAFQSHAAGLGPGAALREFEHLAARLVAAGVTVIVAEDTPEPVKPDAVFPNNWVSFHHDGSVVLYPMLAPNRRLERRDDIVRQVIVAGGFRSTRTVDLSPREAQGQFLEGTGSLVLDRAHGIAYAALSPRTALDVLGDFAQQLDYELVTFDTRAAAGLPVYHTNVMLAVGASFAVVCAAAIADTVHRSAVLARLRATGHEVLEISADQMQRFAGNVLQLEAAAGPVLALSTNALDSLNPAQRRLLERHAALLAVDVPVIERVGGGGVRCMLAEIHLPKR